MKNNPPIGVIGGGLGGLAAACTLAARGHRVTLFERNEWLGGKAAVLEAAAQLLAGRVQAGAVVINDLIVPTADPRLPFGGRGRSGFGVTRGAEGLLEMTAPKVITVRRGKSLPHLDPPHAADAELFHAYIQTVHAGAWRNRLAGVKKLFHSIKQRSTKSNRV